MKKILIILIVILALVGCSRNQVRKQLPVEQRMELANHYYEEGRYRRAADHYQEVVFERRSIHTPLAQFRLAESFFYLGRYEDAVFEYRELIRLFPDFREINIAYFRIGESYMNQSRSPHLSQQETIAAIDAFNVFLDRFPFDAKRDQALQYIQQAQYTLLEKKFYNGYIYYKLLDYSASLLYLEEIIELGNRNELDKKSRYYAALIHLNRGDKENAKPLVDTLIEYYPNTREANRVARRYARQFGD
ncbi:MAG: outer membrane protein assembly factor BamD [Candidatus Cloacimonetes bacterium]|nr:outer membrane protein assembly factor BamD [Candidatus Cloacimonadota bacterium]